MTSYQQRKHEITYLKQRIRELLQKAEFFQKIIWRTRQATGEHLGIEPFSDLYNKEEGPIILDNKGLLDLIRNMPLSWRHSGIRGDEFLTPENCPEAFGGENVNDR